MPAIKATTSEGTRQINRPRTRLMATKTNNNPTILVRLPLEAQYTTILAKSTPVELHHAKTPGIIRII